MYCVSFRFTVNTRDIYNSCGGAVVKSESPDEMPLHNAAFHQGIHCLPKYPFIGIEYETG